MKRPSHQTQLMAILNVTPDSFFSESRFFQPEKAIQRGIELYQTGADIIDIGGESTRPYAQAVDEKEEIARVIPVIEGLKNHIPIDLSIDTSKPSVAQAALEAGATWINDITGLKNPKMQELVKKYKAKVCVMHMQGTPQNMQDSPSYPKGVVQEVYSWFESKTQSLLAFGLDKEQIILDPGIGFGKTTQDNLDIIKHLREFKQLGFQILFGCSRKSFMGKILSKSTQELLIPTVIVNTLASLSQVDILRIHDIPEHKMMRDLLENLYP